MAHLARRRANPADQPDAGLTVTPAIRFNLGKLPGIQFGLDNWLMGGVDIPIAGPKPYVAIYRFTYIKNF
jgi:hypothetical protein